MKNNFVLILALVVMTTIFTGCEPEPSLHELITVAKGYNTEILDLMLPVFENSDPTEFAKDELVTIDDGITCRVTSYYDNELRLFMTMDGWEAADGNEVGGFMAIDIEYYAPSEEVSINIIRMNDPATLYFDRSSVIYLAEFIDYDSSDQAFVSDYDYYFCLSLNDDGKTLMPNTVRYK